MSARGACKAVLVGAVLLLVFGWLAVISVHLLKNDNIKVFDAIGLGRQKRSTGGIGGATYIRWGRTVCPSGAELVYKGFSGGEHSAHVGGASEYICLSDQPVYETFTSEFDPTAWITGVEFKLPGKTSTIFGTSNAKPNALQDSDVQCAVCRSVSKISMIMVPGTTNCPQGWNKEYWGYLMTGTYAHKANHNYACVDNSPEAGSDGGSVNEGGGQMYHVQGWCGSLPCKPYVKGYELTCVVCTK